MAEITEARLTARSNVDITTEDVVPLMKAVKSSIIDVWPLVVVSLILGAVFSWWWNTSQPPTYTTNTTFMVNDESGSSLGSLGGLLGQFGMGIGGSNKVNLDKVRDLAQSYRIVSTVLDKSAEIEGKKQPIYKHIYDIQQLTYDTAALIQTFGFSKDYPKVDSLVNEVVRYQVYQRNFTSNGQPIISVGYDEKSEIFRLSTTTKNAELSRRICNELYQELSEFYVARAVSQPSKTFSTLKLKSDSISNALIRAERQLASVNDRRRGLFLESDEVGVTRLRREVSLLNIMNAESIKNTETAGFILSTNTPVFSQIDGPKDFIAADSPSFLKLFLFGFITSMVGMLFGRYIYVHTVR